MQLLLMLVGYVVMVTIRVINSINKYFIRMNMHVVTSWPCISVKPVKVLTQFKTNVQ